jgi:hypothetical protein
VDEQMSDHRYFMNAENYLDVAELALSEQFPSRADLQIFYDAISTQDRKNQFLRAVSTYHYMVRRGDWIVDSPDCNPLIDYFTNSYKAVGLFAVIESLTDAPFQEFHKWLQSNPELAFPIADSNTLDELLKRYKKTHGSIRRCAAFFGRLSKEKQSALCNAVEIDNKPIGTIKKFSDHLYQLRSKFVHDAEVVLQFSGPTHHLSRKGLMFTNLNMPLIYSAFEEGLVAYFREK